MSYKHFVIVKVLVAVPAPWAHHLLTLFLSHCDWQVGRLIVSAVCRAKAIICCNWWRRQNWFRQSLMIQAMPVQIKWLLKIPFISSFLEFNIWNKHAFLKHIIFCIQFNIQFVLVHLLSISLMVTQCITTENKYKCNWFASNNDYSIFMHDFSQNYEKVHL